MTKATLYPGANQTAQWFAGVYPGAVFTNLEKLLLHTTEGSSWPGYSGGAVAPNFTALPDTASRRLVWRQHWPINQSSRALLHTRTQPTNGDHVVQVELIGTCVPGGPGLYWPTAPDWALQGVANLLSWLHTEWDVPKASTVAWRAYNAPGDRQRLSDTAFDAYRGVLGHQHAPQNDHRDPGSLNVARIIELAGSGGGGGTMAALDSSDVQKIQAGVLYYDLGKDLVNPLTILTRLYGMVSTLVTGETDQDKALAALAALLAGQGDAIAAKVVALLPTGPGASLSIADVETAIKAVLREGTG